MAKKQPAIIEEIDKLGAFRSEEPENQTTNQKDEPMKDFEDTDDKGFGENDSFDGSGDDTFTPDFSDTHDEKILEDGTEALLRVISVDSGMGPKGPYKRIGYEIDGEPFAQAVYNIISMPNANDDARKKNKKNLRLRDFLKAHNMPIDRAFSSNACLTVPGKYPCAVRPGYAVGSRLRRRSWKLCVVSENYNQ